MLGSELTGNSVATLGDAFQITVTGTGHGNSGGPVFSDHGEVIGIFTYMKITADGQTVFSAIPIRHLVDLL
jgi:S1-C subfamily serine protease